jgi:diguanylate cyclase (GGDEF)-like protein/PAS domain S-box-containing protein
MEAENPGNSSDTSMSGGNLSPNERVREEKLRLYRKIMDTTSEGVIVTGMNGKIREVNSAFCAMTGYEFEELLGENPRLLKSGRHDAAFYRSFWDSIRDTGSWTGEIWNRRKNGAVYPSWLAVETVRDEDGKAVSYIGVASDITSLRDAEERLQRAAFYDPLTNLPNRALFRDRLSQTLTRAKREGSRSALLFVDLDNFKNVNESLGYKAGDEFLLEAARRIGSLIREADTLCRLGGDEFVVIVEEVSRSEDAGDTAQAIVQALAAGFPLGPSEVFVGGSVGIALFPFDGTDSGTLEKKAEAAMYEAKEAGRGQYRFASGKAGRSSRRRLELESRLRRALEREEFFLCYQPQVACGGAVPGSNAGIVGAEALIRWKPDDDTLVTPGEFMDIAETSGLIVPIGEWALYAACRDAKTWADAGKPIKVSVNISQRQFQAGTLERVIREVLGASGLDPLQLKLEVTETLLVQDMDKTIATMNFIRSLGVSFAVDDFGIGFSSLQYLDKLPLSTLKIDKTFIDPIVNRYDGAQIATAVIAMARSFNMVSVAEGIETQEQLEALRMRGCDEIQGYLISRPLVAEAFRAFAFEAPEPLPSA